MSTLQPKPDDEHDNTGVQEVTVGVTVGGGKLPARTRSCPPHPATSKQNKITTTGTSLLQTFMIQDLSVSRMATLRVH